MSVRSLRTSELIRRLMPTAREDLEQLVSFGSVADPGQAAPEECEKTARSLAAGSQEQGRGALTALAPDNADLLRADAIVHCGGGGDAVAGAGTPRTGRDRRAVPRVDGRARVPGDAHQLGRGVRHDTGRGRPGRLHPLCGVFQETFPNTEIMIVGVEEPACLVHAPNESVDPREIERMALAQARFLQTYPTPNR
jgi:hypothetical protein